MRKVFVFGDSIVLGRKVAIDSNWVSKLDDFFKYEFKDETITYNLGIPGETSGGLASRIKPEIRSRIKNKNADDFTIIIVSTGINDAKIKKNKIQTSKDELAENARNIIEISKKYADIVVVVGPVRVSEEVLSDFSNDVIGKYNDIMRNVCLLQKTAFVDLFGVWPSLGNDLWSDDGIHPNRKGYEFIFKKVIEKLNSFKCESIDHQLVLEKELSISKNKFQEFKLRQGLEDKFNSDLFLGNLQQKFVSPDVVLGGPCIRNDIEGINLNTFYQILMPIKVSSIIGKPCWIYIGLKEEIISAPGKAKELELLKEKLVTGINRISSDFGVKTKIIDTAELQIDKYIQQCMDLDSVHLSKEESEDLYNFGENQVKAKQHTPTRILMNERVISCHGSRFVNKATGFKKYLIVEDFEQIKAYLYLKNKKVGKAYRNARLYSSDFLAFLPLPDIYLSATMFKSGDSGKIFLSKLASEYEDLWRKMNPSSKKIYNEVLRILGIPSNKFISNIDNFIDGMKRISSYFN